MVATSHPKIPNAENHGGKGSITIHTKKVGHMANLSFA